MPQTVFLIFFFLHFFATTWNPAQLLNHSTSAATLKSMMLSSDLAKICRKYQKKSMKLTLHSVIVVRADTEFREIGLNYRSI